MGKPTGFLDYEREDARAESPKERMYLLGLRKGQS